MKFLVSKSQSKWLSQGVPPKPVPALFPAPFASVTVTRGAHDSASLDWHLDSGLSAPWTFSQGVLGW